MRSKSGTLPLTLETPRNQEGAGLLGPQHPLTQYSGMVSLMKLRSSKIPEASRDFFRQKGYVHLRDFFSADAARYLHTISNEMSSQAASILNSTLETGESLARRAKAHPLELIVVSEALDPTQVCRYEFMVGGNSNFRQFVADHVAPTVSELVGKNVLPFKDKTNEKLPKGGAFRPHQDFAAYRFFGPHYHVTALLSIDPADLANGCVQFATNFSEIVSARPDFVADSVEGRMLMHYNTGGPNHGDIRADIASQFCWQPLECNALDLVVFDSFAPHFSNGNNSAKPRRAIFVTFNLTSEGSFYAEYYADKRSNYDDPKFHVSTPTLHNASSDGL
jgi:ectoine hydroxylase-related dioxygenase (phytanoyl-CoA dioxygenase family)